MPDSEISQNLFLYSQAMPARRDATFTDSGSTVTGSAAKNDEDAFADLYSSFGPLVHGILLARLPYDEVKDAVQDVFVTAYKNLHSIRDINAVGGWLARIARNHAAEYYRTHRRTEELPMELKDRHHPHAEAAEILTCIKSLPDTYRETLILRLIEGMTGNEIAQRT